MYGLNELVALNEAWARKEQGWKEVKEEEEDEE